MRSINNLYDSFIKPQAVAPDSMLFTKLHIGLSLLCVFLILLVFSFEMKVHDENYSKMILRNASIIMLILEIFRIGWITYYYGFSIKNIRFDLCNQICLALPFIVLSENKKLLQYINILAFIGGITVIVYPRWVFYDYAGLHIMAIQSMLSHTLMVIISISMIFISDYRFDTNGAIKAFIGFCCIAFVAFIMSMMLKTNYMLMLNADGIPLLKNYNYPWYWLVAIPIAVLVINIVNSAFIVINKKIFYGKISTMNNCKNNDVINDNNNYSKEVDQIEI